MRQWNGLLRKEWTMMNGQFYAVLIAAIMFTILIPFGSSFLKWGSHALNLAFVLSVIWMITSMLIPVIILLISFGKEASRPDLLLHSTASIFKIFGSKAVFAALVGAISMLMPTLVISVGSRYSEWLADASFQLIVELVIICYLVLYVQSLLVMGHGLFFGVLYQLIKPTIKGFSIPVVVLLFLLLSWIAERISSSGIYEKLTQFWPNINVGEGVFSLMKGSQSFELDLLGLNLGVIVIDLLFAVFLFVVAMVLFEKKVRI